MLFLNFEIFQMNQGQFQTACSCHVTYAFQSESTLYIHSEWITTQLNHVVRLAKWLSVRLRTKWLWIREQLQSLRQFQNFQKSRGWFVRETWKSPKPNMWLLVNSCRTDHGRGKKINLNFYFHSSLFCLERF